MRNVRAAAVPQVQLVTFRLGGEEFGLDVFQVHEILRYSETTPMPKAPAFVEGVLDVRGTLVPVVDLRKRFELHDLRYDDDTRIILVDFQAERLGLVVDEVSEVLRVPETAVTAPPQYVKGLAAEFIRGIVRMEGRLVVLLDLERILSSQERMQLLFSGLVGGEPTDEAAAAPAAAPAGRKGAKG